jgi:hypothetical protein
MDARMDGWREGGRDNASWREGERERARKKGASHLPRVSRVAIPGPHHVPQPQHLALPPHTRPCPLIRPPPPPHPQPQLIPSPPSYLTKIAGACALVRQQEATPPTHTHMRGVHVYLSDSKRRLLPSDLQLTRLNPSPPMEIQKQKKSFAPSQCYAVTAASLFAARP